MLHLLRGLMGDKHDDRDDKRDKIFEQIEEWLEKIANEQTANLPAIEVDLNLIARSLADIANLLRPRPRADKLELNYHSWDAHSKHVFNAKGATTMGQFVSMNVGKTATPSVIETAAGVPVAPAGPLVYASDNAAVVSVDPTSGVATGVSAGSANVSVLDQGNGLSDTVAFSISLAPPPPADKLTLDYSVNP